MKERQVGNAPSSEPQDSPAGEELRVLVVEDVPADAELIERELEVAGFRCRTLRVDTEAEVQAALEQRPPDLVLSDYSLPMFDGMRVLELARKHAPDVPVVIVTGSLDEETAVECMKAGAADYVLKENLRRLVPVVQKTLESVRLRRQREEASAALAATEERLRLLGAALEAAANAMVITDREGSIVWVNPAFTLLTGYEADDVVGSNPRLLRSGHHDPQFYAGLWGAILSGQMWHGEMVNRRKDGSLYHEEMTITPVRDAAGEISHFIAVKEDVTERRQIERRLLHAQRMEAVGRLAGGVAHDFNNLLQAMLSLTQVLRAEGNTTASGDLLGELEEHIRRGAQVTRQLLLFSRRETPRFERVDLNHVVLEGTRLLKRLLKETIGVKVVTAAGELLLEADRMQLEQVLVNLALNGADAMPEGGTLTVRTGRDTAGRVWLEVEDTGCGIPDEVRQHLFEPFFTTKDAGQGAGLGLAVVQGIVTGHGGSVRVDSEVGRGTTLRVEVPASHSGAFPALSSKNGPAGTPRGGGERVLLVEDEVGARRAIGDILRALGYKVVAAASAEEALSVGVEPPPDLLLSDVILPGKSGAELASELKALRPALNVVLMSGYTDDEAVQRAAANGTLRLLAKPFDMATLASAVRAALDTEP